MLFVEIITVCRHIDIEQTKTLCVQGVDFPSASPGGTCSNHSAPKTRYKFLRAGMVTLIASGVTAV
jgi:hypothetical protein